MKNIRTGFRNFVRMVLVRSKNSCSMKSVLFKHRSIRKFRPAPIPEELLRECLEAASRASTCGNMQLYSLIVTRDKALRERLAPCHFNQSMVTEAPCVVTICADVHRFTMWCEQRGADPAYDNFGWFMNGVTDALLAAQNLCVEAEIDELWAEREESPLTRQLLEENGLPNLAQVFTQRRYVRRDNLAFSQSYFALLKEKGFFNNN